MSRAAPTPLPRAFYRRDPRVVGPELLHKVIEHVDGDGVRRAGRIVEVEAYAGAEDPAAHTYRGPTPRNAVMFGPPGHLYVYFSYGVHWCANAVTGDEGTGTAVLLRALEPVDGVPAMRSARGAAARRDRDIASGPGKLCQALGLDRRHDGADLVAGDRGVRILDDGVDPPSPHGISGRIGISVAVDEPWRFYVPGSPHLSRRSP